MKKVILAIAVAFVFAFSGSVLASPPVPPPDQGFVIETYTDILCTGGVIEDENFAWRWSRDGVDPINDLVEDQSIGEITYEQEFNSFYGINTVFIKDFDAKSHVDGTQNLEVDKTIGYVSDGAAGAIADHDERVSVVVVSAGGDMETAFPGALALCPMLGPNLTEMTATNESIAMGSSFNVGSGGAISSHTETNAYVTESVELGYEINADGYGVTVNAGMRASLWEGDLAGTDVDVASRTTYYEFAQADGFVDKFHKEMLYQSTFTEPTPIPPDIRRILIP
jgi:hypothetical protein